MAASTIISVLRSGPGDVSPAFYAITLFGQAWVFGVCIVAAVLLHRRRGGRDGDPD